MQRKVQELPQSLWQMLSPRKGHPWSLSPSFAFDEFTPLPPFNQERLQKRGGK